MSPAAMIALVAMVACGGAHLDAEGATLELLSEINADNLALSDGQDVTTWAAVIGPSLIEDETAAYGVPTYVAVGINGLPSVAVDRNDYPRLIFAAPLHSQRENWLIHVVHNPDTVDAGATTRGYLEGWTEDFDLDVEGTRFAYAQNANSGDSPLNRIGVSLDDFNFEQPGMNRGWHGFYDQHDVRRRTIAGPQYSTIVLTNVGLPTWWRNGELVGVGKPNQYVEPYRRAPSAYAVLWSDIPGGEPGDTTTFYNGQWRARELHRIVGLQLSLETIQSLHLAFGAKHGF